LVVVQKPVTETSLIVAVRSLGLFVASLLDVATAYAIERDLSKDEPFYSPRRL